MVDLVSKVNQDILIENRINSLRNQKEEIRRRLQNPGLYPDPKATTLQQYTNEFRPASSTPLPVLAQMFNTGRQGIDSNSSSSVGGKDGVGGLGFGSGIAGLGGTIAGMAAGRAGMGPLSGVVSALASGMLGSRDPSKNIGLAFGKGLLGMVSPAATKALAMYSLFNTLSNLFGYTGETSGKIGTTESTESVGRIGYYGSLLDALFGDISFDPTTKAVAMNQMDEQAVENDSQNGLSGGGMTAGSNAGLGSGLGDTDTGEGAGDGPGMGGNSGIGE